MSEEETKEINAMIMHALNCAESDLIGAAQLLGSEGHGKLCLRTVEEIKQLKSLLTTVKEQRLAATYGLAETYWEEIKELKSLLNVIEEKRLAERKAEAKADAEWDAHWKEVDNE